MLSRRNLFSSAGTALAMATLPGRAQAEDAFLDLEPRGNVGRYERVPELMLESIQNYTSGLRLFYRNVVGRTARRRVTEILTENGIDPRASVPMKEVVDLVGKDPVVAMAGRLWLSNQQITWSAIAEWFHGEADRYLEEMESYDRRGPGSLELNPKMSIPDYALHEFHIQPGGYVGDPFAGHVYHYGTQSFYHEPYDHGNMQDDVQAEIASKIPLPPDGKVKRILDLGTSIGQLAIALKERFPDAEVWALDVGGPMVRYGHMRAVDLGVDVNFVQRLAEQSGFPDDHFDIVTSYLLHHEVPADVSRAIFAEVHRILRPGGHYYPVDFRTGNQGFLSSATSQFRLWWDHRWNGEPWSLEYRALDLEREMGAVGLPLINADAPQPLRGYPSRQGIKT